jgi:hypothetical protein
MATETTTTTTTNSDGTPSIIPNQIINENNAINNFGIDPGEQRLDRIMMGLMQIANVIPEENAPRPQIQEQPVLQVCIFYF